MYLGKIILPIIANAGYSILGTSGFHDSVVMTAQNLTDENTVAMAVKPSESPGLIADMHCNSRVIL